MVSIYYFCMQQMQHDGAPEPIYRHDSVVDFFKESRWLYDGPNRIGCHDGLFSLSRSIVTDHGADMKDLAILTWRFPDRDHKMSQIKSSQDSGIQRSEENPFQKFKNDITRDSGHRKHLETSKSGKLRAQQRPQSWPSWKFVFWHPQLTLSTYPFWKFKSWKYDVYTCAPCSRTALAHHFHAPRSVGKTNVL